MSYEIIDFHTHPFTCDDNNICSYIPYCDMTIESTRELFRKLGIDRICGAVIINKGVRPKDMSNIEIMRYNNDTALALRDIYGDFYIPGVHIHPESVQASCDEIERMHKAGVRMLGELVPYFDCWERYATKEIDEIMDCAKQYGMIVNIHPMQDDDTDEFVRRHPDLTIIGAHPEEYGGYERQLARMRANKNYYLDTAGYGIFRHGLLRRGVAEFGAERFLFGSDYPTCNPAMYLGGIKDDPLLTDSEKELILGGNAKRLLGLD